MEILLHKVQSEPFRCKAASVNRTYTFLQGNVDFVLVRKMYPLKLWESFHSAARHRSLLCTDANTDSFYTEIKEADPQVMIFIGKDYQTLPLPAFASDVLSLLYFSAL